jgi:hypothetical protein
LTDPRIGTVLTPCARFRGPHTCKGEKGTCLAVCPDGTNGLICEAGVLVILMESGVVRVDSADNWAPWTERTSNAPRTANATAKARRRPN